MTEELSRCDNCDQPATVEVPDDCPCCWRRYCDDCRAESDAVVELEQATAVRALKGGAS